MHRITSLSGAFCLALLMPALADAQGSDSSITLSTGQTAARLTSRPLAAAAHTALPGLPERRSGVPPAAAASSAADSCRVDSIAAESEPDDPRWRWRLRAFRHLDCVNALVDAALTGAAALNDEGRREVRVSRDDLERIRTLAWWARDAAARIGQ